MIKAVKAFVYEKGTLKEKWFEAVYDLGPEEKLVFDQETQEFRTIKREHIVQEYYENNL